MDSIDIMKFGLEINRIKGVDSLEITVCKKYNQNQIFVVQVEIQLAHRESASSDWAWMTIGKVGFKFWSLCQIWSQSVIIKNASLIGNEYLWFEKRKQIRRIKTNHFEYI